MPVRLVVEAAKVTVLAPAATATEEGTVSNVLLVVTDTIAPPAGAPPDSEIVQVLDMLLPNTAGVHDRPLTTMAAVREIDVVCEPLL